MYENNNVLIKRASSLELHPQLCLEDDNGNIEYKIQLLNLDSKRFHKLATQMKWRISEGNGVCYYYIGITNDGSPKGICHKYMKESIDNLIKITKYLKYTYEILYYKQGISGGFCTKVFIINNNSSISLN
jgi:GTPase